MQAAGANRNESTKTHPVDTVNVVGLFLCANYNCGVGVSLGTSVAVIITDGVIVAAFTAVFVGDAVTLRVPRRVSLGRCDSVGRAVDVLRGEGVSVSVFVGRGVRVNVSVYVGRGVRDRLAVFVGRGVSLGSRVSVGRRVSDGRRVALGFDVLVSRMVALARAVRVILGLARGSNVRVGRAVSVGSEVSDPLRARVRAWAEGKWVVNKMATSVTMTMPATIKCRITTFL